MSKFNAGDWWSIEEFDGTQEEAIRTAVDYLLVDGRELEDYLQDNSVDGLCRWRCIGIRPYDETITVFDYVTDYAFDEGKKLSWSEFKESPSLKVGDKVMLSPESRWVGSCSDKPYSSNPTGVVGAIVREHNSAHEEDTEFHWNVKWSNGTSNAYHSEDLLLVTVVSVGVETNLHDILEEQVAHIENLEEALEMVTKELIELRGELNSPEFKPICDMTMQDWQKALKEGWVFEMGDGEEVVVNSIMGRFNDPNHPIELSLLTGEHEATVTVRGYFWYNRPDHCRNVKQRIK